MFTMSAMGDKNHGKRGAKRRYSQGGGATVNWSDVGGEAIKGVLAAVTATGCAIRFGYSRDQGAFAIGIVGDGDPYTVWAANLEELDIKLEALEQAFHTDGK